MYKILIADDDDLVREGLRHFVDWEQLGFAVDGFFEDGADVINHLKENAADVVLADIRMYDVSGLDLAQHIAKHHPNMKVIIFSAYSEFEYLRESIRLGVIDYLLKPIKQDELTRTLLRVRAQLDAAKNTSAFQRENLIAQGRLLIQAIENGTDEAHAEAAWHDLFSRTPEPLCRSAVNDLLLEVFRGAESKSMLPRLSLSSTLAEEHNTPFSALAAWTVSRLRELLAPEAETNRPSLPTLVENYVTDHISVDFSIEDMAHSLYFNVDYLSREFKRLTGEVLSSYIIHRRMALAMSLLQSDEYSVAQVARSCGYYDTQYFNRAFKNHTGMSAREWRARHGEADGYDE